MYDRLLKVWAREIGLMDLASVTSLQENHRPVEGQFDRFRHAIWSLAVARKWHLLFLKDLRDRNLPYAWQTKSRAREWSRNSKQYIKSL